VFQAVEDIGPHLNGFTVIATKSTVPVGTSRDIKRRLKAINADADFAICSNPEFLREGSAIYDFTHPDRVLVGCDEPRAQELMERLYKPLALRNAPVMFVSRESAELAKYSANAFLAMKISFINEISDLCEAVGADVQEVATAMGADGRIGNKFLHPGPGYGGSCFPKDVAALIRTAREARQPVSLIEQVQTVNSERKIAMAGRIERIVGGSLSGKTIALKDNVCLAGVPMMNGASTLKGYALGVASRFALKITADDLVRGKAIECKDLGEMLDGEQAVITACQNLKAFLEAAESFDGRELVVEI
jgi:UDPglucose 6-dehydrogenase